MIHIDWTDEVKEDYKEFIKNGRGKKFFKASSKIGLLKKLEDIRKECSNDNERNFIEYLIENLDKILVDNINILRNYLNDIKTKFAQVLEDIEKREPIYGLLESVFISYGYKTLVYSIAYELVRLLDIQVCPYCNRQYISVVNKEDGLRGTRPQLDHFFPKSKYPFFAVSLYNLVPTCATCNFLKSDQFKETLKSPYEIEDDPKKISNDEEGFVFSFEINNNLKIVGNSLKTIEEGIERICFKKQVTANNQIFRLEDIYQYHKDVVAEIIAKKRFEVDKKLEWLANIFDFDQRDLYRIVWCNYGDVKDFSKRPLAKLIYDILKELE